MNNKIHTIFIIIVALVFIPLLHAEPTLNGSSVEAFAISCKEVIEDMENNTDVGIQDKAKIRIVLAGILVNLQTEVLRIGGPNVTPSEAQEIGKRLVEKYNGLEGMQLLKQLQQEHEEKEKNIAEEKNADIKNKNTLKETTINNWLEDKECELGVPSHYSYSLKLRENSNETGEWGICVEVIDDLVRNGFDNNFVLNGFYNNSLSNFTSFELFHNSNSGFPDYLPIDYHSNIKTIPSTELFTWMIPKFKEWTKKVLSSPENERPDCIVKKIPLNLKEPTHIINKINDQYIPNPNSPTIVWFAYDKKHGPGLLVYDRSYDNDRIECVGINAEAREHARVKNCSKAVDAYLTKCDSLDSALKEFQNVIHWIDLEKVKVASDIPIVLSQFLASKKAEVDKANKQLAEKAESDKKAKQRLDLN